MTTFEVSVTAAMENAMKSACHEVSLVLVGELAQQHGFEADSAIKSLGLDRFVTVRRAAKGKSKAAAEPKEVVKKPKFPLPWCGVANKCNCRALRLNHGLYTQCTQKVAKGMRYCKTCQKGADRSATGKPTYGTVEDRQSVGILDFVAPNGKKVIPYANVMEKLNISRDDAQAEAKEFSELIGADTIPEEQFTLRVTKRGRPKKESTKDDGEQKPKKRGRPKKKVAAEGDSDLVSALVAAADSSDAESVASSTSTSSRGRPRLSEEEKERRAQEKADKKAAREKAALEAKQQKEAAAIALKAEKLATKRQNLIDEINTLNSELATAMDISTLPEEISDLKSMIVDMKKQKKEDAKAAREQAALKSKQEKEAAAAKAKQEREAAAQAKRTPLVTEITTLSAELNKDVPAQLPEKIGELRTMVADLKREIREAKKAAKKEEKPTQEPTPVPTQEPTPVSTQEVEEEEDELEEEEVEVSVDKFEHNGINYLKSSDGILYDPETQEVKGVWNESTQSIDEAPEEDSEDEDEDDEDDDDSDEE